MRKFSAIFFTVLYLFSTTESYQFLKIPLVVKHYAEHLAEGRDTNMLTFLDKHFIHGHDQDGDHEKDMQLPFKRTSRQMLFAVPSFTPLVTIMHAEPPNRVINTVQNSSLGNNRILPAFTANIWQPPKTC